MSEVIRRASRALRHSIYIASVRCFFIFYILVGLPNGFQSRFLPLYFRSHGMSLARVGMFRLLVLPWLLKGGWTAYMDRDTDVRVWLKTSLLLLVLLCLGAAQLPPTHMASVAVVLFSLNTITSVQDTAVDSLLMDSFTPAQLLVGNVAQGVGDRLGSIISGGLFSWYIDVLTWASVFYIMAFMYAIGLLTSYYLLPDWSVRPSSVAPSRPVGSETDVDNTTMPSRSTASISDSWKQFYNESSLWMITFVLFYKIGEVGVINLFPLFLLDHGIETSEIGFWLGIIGQTVSVVGSIAVAFYTFSSILGPLAALMVVRALCVTLIWLVVVSWKVNPGICYASGVVCTVIVSLTGGAISTCTQTLLMQLSQLAPRHERAKHYAIYSFGELLAKLLFSAGVGALAEMTSYEFAFALFALAAALVVPFALFAPSGVNIQMDY